MDSMTTIDDLPDDALVEIFSYLSLADLIKSVQNVCLRWRLTALYSDLWIDLVYSPDDVETDDHIVGVLQETPKLETLIFEWRPVGHKVLSCILQCPKLKRVEFHERQRLSEKFLGNMLQKCPNIAYLRLPNEVLNKVKCSDVIARFPNLRTLILGKYENWDYPAVLKPLGDGCPSLRHLNVVKEMHTHNDLGYFLEKKKDHLVSLAVGWTSADCMNTIPLLVVCRKLKTLQVDSFHDSFVSGTQDVEIKPYFESFSRLSTVTSLTLSELHNLKVGDLISIFSNRRMSQLTKLRIVSYNCYQDIVGKAIIENCPNLKLLHFSQCPDLSDTTAELLHTLSELEDLNLNFSNFLTVRGMGHIIKCEKLKSLDLNSCKKLKEDSMKLIISLGNLRILRLAFCDVKGLDVHKFPSHLKHLSVLDLEHSVNVDQKSLMELKVMMPRLIIDEHGCEYLGEQVRDTDNCEILGAVLEYDPPSSDIALGNVPFLFDPLEYE